MKKSVKILSAVLCVFMALSFAACGGKNTENDEKKSTEVNAETTSGDVVTESGEDIILPEDGKIVFADKNKTKENKDNKADKGNTADKENNASKDKNENKDKNKDKDKEKNTTTTTAKNNGSSGKKNSDSGSTTTKGGSSQGTTAPDGSTTKKNDTPASGGESDKDSEWGGIQWNN